MSIDTSSYRALDPDHTVATIDRLHDRIKERFPTAGLLDVCGELLAVARESRAKAEWISRRHLGLRIAVGILILLGITGICYAVQQMRLAEERMAISTLVSLVEAGTNEVILLGAALFFLITLESRLKRRRAMTTLHDLRAMAHVIDMHQLTKDPASVLSKDHVRTASSPKRDMTAFELTRYLEYCTEMEALIGKLGALYAQSIPDPVVVAAVNDIEQLTTGLSRKIWEKILMIDREPLLPTKSPSNPITEQKSDPASTASGQSGN